MSIRPRGCLLLICAWLVLPLIPMETAAAAEPVQVYILAGQSNMEGKARISLLEHQITAPETMQQFAHLHKDGQWIERDDVWIKFLDRKGKLTVGFGSPGCIGPELEFGNTVGDHFQRQVLLIKTAWGGKSLFRDFRPPSAGLPSEETLAQLLKNAQKKRPETTPDDVTRQFGAYYRQMIAEVSDTLAHLEEHFPDYAGQGYEIAGLVWFQGWNDMINADYTAEYATNMAHFIRDVRRDLKKPDLPVVVGQLGVDGVHGKPNPKRDAFKQAQAAVGQMSEFADTVRVVRTDVLWDEAADAVFRKGHREHLEEWQQVGSDRPYHYLGSVTCYSRIGRAFGQAMLGLHGMELRGDELNIVELPSVDSPATAEAKSFFDPVAMQLNGWTLAVDPQLLSGEHQETGRRALEALGNHLERISYIVAEDRLERLRTLPIWLELDHPELGNMQYHPGRGWLLAHGHDPRLVKHVHIPRARQLFNRRTWAKHPYVILHELAHAYHDQILSFDEPAIVAAFEEAKQEGIYEKVLLHTGRYVRHYGLSNHKEYFAESTEAYFGVNDFYPFVRAELKEHDRRIYDLLEEIWGEVD